MAVTGMQRIVVGIDGSVGADHALSWALRIAAATGGDLAVVSAWHRGITRDAASVSDAFMTDADLADVTLALIDDAFGRLADEVAAAREAGCDVQGHAREGTPDDVLMAAALETDLLVVGRRGHGALGRLLGSTSSHLADHAPCAVVLVPAVEAE